MKLLCAPCLGCCCEERNEPQNWVCNLVRLLTSLGKEGLLLLQPSMVGRGWRCVHVRVWVCVCVQIATLMWMSQGSSVRREGCHVGTGNAKPSTFGTHRSVPHPDVGTLPLTFFWEPRVSAVLLTF